jgi:hypothetical protein
VVEVKGVKYGIGTQPFFAGDEAVAVEVVGLK